MRKWTSLLFAFLFLPAVAWGITTEELLQKLQVRAKELSAKIRSMKVVSETESTLGGKEFAIRTVVYQKGNKLRSESEPIKVPPDVPKDLIAGAKTITIFDGKKMWLIADGKPQPIPVGMGSVDMMKPTDDMGWLQQWKDAVNLIGEEVVDGRDCYVVELTRPAKTKIYIDKATLDWIKTEQEVNGDKIVVERKDFEELPDVPGFYIPLKLEVYMNGEKMASTRVIDIKVNPELSDTLFVVKTSAKVEGTTPNEREGGQREGKWDILEQLKK